MKIGEDLFATNTHRLVPVFYTERDCDYVEGDTESYYGFVRKPGYIPYSRDIGNKDQLIKRLSEIKSNNPSFMQMKNWIIMNL